MDRERLLCRMCMICIFQALAFFTLQAIAQSENTVSKIDALHYTAHVEPNIANGTIQGKVTVQFVMKEGNGHIIELDRGRLSVDSVYIDKEAIPFQLSDGHLRLEMKNPIKVNQPCEVEIIYHGKPPNGVQFFPEIRQVYTVFFTRQWMVCNDDPDDRATLQLNLTMPGDLQTVSNGTLSRKTSLANGKVEYEWSQKTPVPSYTFGFAAGRFNTFMESAGATKLQYFGGSYTKKELARIFQETVEMIGFFEDRAGLPYPGPTFSQILAEGNVSQEMAAFAVLRNSYGKQVLNNETEINLSAHELAHQWWGNQITCKNWCHFWLNEGFAVFMSSAYKGHRFGNEAYLKDINAYFEAYKKVVEKGLDKPLVFPDWLQPTADDRVLVYYKGAYVLHLLREMLGEETFWKAIKVYSRAYFGKSVTSEDFQRVMESASGRGLDSFFKKWVY